MKAVIFPGEGAHYVGMGKNLYENFASAWQIFDRIDKILGWKLSQICFSGPSEELKYILIQELAILAVSLSAYEVFKKKNLKIDFFSGLSSGECTCLYPAGVLSLEDLIFFVRARAKAMQEASRVNPSCLMAVIGLRKELLEQKSKEFGFYLANINSPQQIVIALRKEDRQKIKDLLSSWEGRVFELEVEGGFHSPFMEATKDRFKKDVANLKFRPAKVPIVSNFTGRAHLKPQELKDNLIQQLVFPVRWQSCVEFMIKKGVKVFYEIGPSQILRGLIKTISPDAEVIHLEKKADWDKLS